MRHISSPIYLLSLLTVVPNVERSRSQNPTSKCYFASSHVFPASRNATTRYMHASTLEPLD